MPSSIPEQLKRFEAALAKRNPELARRLQKGISEKRILKKIADAKIRGDVQPIIDLFCWKNGSDLDPTLTHSQASPFPESIYIFMDFGMMLAHFQGFEEFAQYHPRYTDVVGRYFPIFWSGSDEWLAVDLDSASKGRVVFLIGQSENVVFEVYPSFEDFLEDAIRANEENEELTCFSKLLQSAEQNERCCTYCHEPKSKVGGLALSKHSASICGACLAICCDLAKKNGASLKIPSEPLVEVYWEK